MALRRRRSWWARYLIAATMPCAVLLGPLAAQARLEKVTLVRPMPLPAEPAPPDGGPVVPLPGEEPMAAAVASEAPADAPPPAAPQGPCARALDWVADAGLRLPDGVGYHCPSTEFAHQGAACWADAACVDAPFIAVNMDLLPGVGTGYLRHVVAHEVCHILDYQATGTTTEWGADACAAAHGAPA